VRYTKMQRYFLPRYNALERALVAANFYQNIIFFFTVNTPLLLRVAHEILFGTGIPITGLGKQVLGYAVLLQLFYDAYWTTRLWNSYFRHARSGTQRARRRSHHPPQLPGEVAGRGREGEEEGVRNTAFVKLPAIQ